MKTKINLKVVVRSFKFVYEICFQIMFEGIESLNTLEYVRGLIPKSWTNIWQSKLNSFSLKWTFSFLKTTSLMKNILCSKIKDFILITGTFFIEILENTHRANIPSNKTEALTESMNMYIWAIGALNELFLRDSYTQTKFLKNEVVSGKSPFSVIGLFCTLHSICLNIFFWQGSFIWKCCAFIRSTLKKKMYSSFLRTVLVHQKTCLKVEESNTFKIPSDFLEDHKVFLLTLK